MEEKSKRRPALRLRVLYTQVECGFGFGVQKLHDCFLNSVTPSHVCRDPGGTGAERCPQVAVMHEKHGWRTYRVDPEWTSVNSLGEPHQAFPFTLLYQPLDAAGLSWYALNAATGQRYEVVLHDVVAEPRGHYILAEKAPHARMVEVRGVKMIPWTGFRKTPEGEDVEQDSRTVDSKLYAERIAQGGVMWTPYVFPIWNDVPPRNQWSCKCATCSGEETRGREETAMRSGDPFESKALVDSTNVKSAGASASAGQKYTTREWREKVARERAKENPGRYFGGGNAIVAARRERLADSTSTSSTSSTSSSRSTSSRPMKTSDVISTSFEQTTKKSGRR